MNFKNKNGFITVYVLISMIFLITIITVSLINSSRKLKNQSQINSEIYAMHNEEDIDNLIIDYTTEIPIYTEEQFTHLKNWINNTKRAKEYMNINGNLYELDPEKYSEYSGILKTDLYINEKSELEGIKINKNNFIIHDKLLEKLQRLYEGIDALPSVENNNIAALDVTSYNDTKGCYSLLPINGEEVEGNEVYILITGRTAIIKVGNYKFVVSIKEDKISKIQYLPEAEVWDLGDLGREMILMNPEDFLNEDNELLLLDIDYETLIKTPIINAYEKLSFNQGRYRYLMLNENVENLTLDFKEINLNGILVPKNYKGTITTNIAKYIFPYEKDDLYITELDGKEYYSIPNS